MAPLPLPTPSPPQHLAGRIWSALFDKNTASSSHTSSNSHCGRSVAVSTPSEHDFKLSPCTFPPPAEHPTCCTPPQQHPHNEECQWGHSSSPCPSVDRRQHLVQLINNRNKSHHWDGRPRREMRVVDYSAVEKRPRGGAEESERDTRDMLLPRDASGAPNKAAGKDAPFGLPPAGYVPVVLTLHKPASAQMGLSLIAAEEEEDGGLQGYFKIRRLLDAGACKRDGRVREGDVVAMVNGQHLRHWPQMHVISLLRRPVHQVSMVLLRRKTPPPNNHETPTTTPLDRDIDTKPHDSNPRTQVNRGTPSTPVTPHVGLSPKLGRGNNRGNAGSPKLASDEGTPNATSRGRQVVPSVQAGGADTDEEDASLGWLPPPLPRDRHERTGGNANNEHTFSDEDSDDEQEHNDVVASLIHKYDPRNPFSTATPAPPTPGTKSSHPPMGEAAVSQPRKHNPGSSSEKAVTPIAAASADAHSEPPLPLTLHTMPQAHVHIPPIELSDVDNSDTNLSQFDINGHETPPMDDKTQQTPPQPHPPAKALPPETRNTAIQTAPLSQPRRNIYPPGYFHSIQPPDHRTRDRNHQHSSNSLLGIGSRRPWSWSEDEETDSEEAAPHKYFVPVPEPEPKREVRSRSGLSTSSPIMEKLDNLSAQLEQLLNPDNSHTSRQRGTRPYSAAAAHLLIAAEPPLSPISPSPPEVNNQRCKSIDDLRVIRSAEQMQDSPLGPLSSIPKTPPLLIKKSPTSKSTPDLIQNSTRTPLNPFQYSSPKSERQFKPVDLPPTNYREIKRPKSRRKTRSPEDEDDDLSSTDRFLRDVHNLSAEFHVDPRTPLTESFRFPKSPQILLDKPEESADNDNRQTPNGEPALETNYLSELIENSDLALDDLSRSSSVKHPLEEEPENEDENFDLEERQPENDPEEMLQRPTSEMDGDPEDDVLVAPPMSFATEMGENEEPEEAIDYCNILPPPKAMAASVQQLYPQKEFVTYGGERDRARRFSTDSNQSSLHSNHTFEVDYPVTFQKPRVHQGRQSTPNKVASSRDAVNFIPEDEVELQVLKESLKPPDKKHLFLNRERPKETKRSNSDKADEFCRAKRKAVKAPFKDIDLLLDAEAKTPAHKAVIGKPPKQANSEKPESKEQPRQQTNGPPAGMPPLPPPPPLLTERRSTGRDSTLRRNRRNSPRFQQARGSSVPPSIGPAGSNTARSTLDSVSFTIPLDDNDYENDFSIASTPTILKNSFEDLTKLGDFRKRKEFEIPEKGSLADQLQSKEKENGLDAKPKTPKKDATEKRAPVNGMTPTLNEPPSMVNLISYDDWKKSLKQELQPGDKIKRPVSVRHTKSPFPGNRKKKDDNKTKPVQKDSSNGCQKPARERSASPRKSRISREPVSNPKEAPNKPKTTKLQQPRTRPREGSPAKSLTAVAAKPPSHESSPPTGANTSQIAQPSDSSVAKPEASAKASPIKEEQPEPTRLSLSAQKSDAAAAAAATSREKLGFNVSLENFNKQQQQPTSAPPRKATAAAAASSPGRSSVSPRGRAPSPRVTPSNSFVSGSCRPPTATNSHTTPTRTVQNKCGDDTASTTPKQEQAGTGPREKKGATVATAAANFKFAQNDFTAKKNYFELSARLKAQRAAVAAKHDDKSAKTKGAPPKSASPHKPNSSSSAAAAANPVWI